MCTNTRTEHALGKLLLFDSDDCYKLHNRQKEMCRSCVTITFASDFQHIALKRQPCPRSQ